MKNYEVGIIVVAVLAIAWYWYQNAADQKPANPTNATSKGYKCSNPCYNPMLGNPTV